MKAIQETEPLFSNASTVLGTVDDWALKQIRLPMLKMGSQEKSQMASTLLSTNSALQCETSTWPCSHALEWWSELITLVPLLNLAKSYDWEKQRERLPKREMLQRHAPDSLK